VFGLWSEVYIRLDGDSEGFFERVQESIRQRFPDGTVNDEPVWSCNSAT
jgi:hypothetical protein